MHFEHVQGRRYARFERLRCESGLTHAFATRPLDVSLRKDEHQAERAANRHQMAADLGLGRFPLHCCVQVHQGRIAFIDDECRGGPLEGFDAVATPLSNVALMTFSADCPLVLICDPVRRVLALVHASWRCAVASLAQRVVEAVQERYGCEPDDLLAAIGPAAGPCCYEVQRDVFEAAGHLPQPQRLFERRDGRLYFDLWQANRAQLLAAGVRPDNVETADICTMCHNDVFYSLRRERPGCGHFGLMAALTER